jgi:hypothetical protein
MLTTDRKGEPLVKILDMGLALLDNPATPERRDLTTTGQMMGTLDYMAPEQGTDSHEVDIRADIYSLGATLYRLLCSEPPFSGEKYNTPARMIIALATETPPSIADKRSDLPAELVAVVDRMLAKNPDDRFSTPEEVGTAFEPFVDGCDLTALLEATSREQSEADVDQSSVKTSEHLSSGSVDTHPTIDHAPNATLGQDARAARSPHGPPPKATLKPAPNTEAKPSVKPTRWSRNRIVAIAAVSALGGIILLAAVVTLFIQAKHGTVVVHINDPNIQVMVDSEKFIITDGNTGHEFKVQPGPRRLRVKRGGLEFTTDTFTVERGDKVALSVKFVEGQILVVEGKNNVIARETLPNYALQFDGKDNFVEIPSLTLSAFDPITVEAWITVANRFHFIPIHDERLAIPLEGNVSQRNEAKAKKDEKKPAKAFSLADGTLKRLAKAELIRAQSAENQSPTELLLSGSTVTGEAMRFNSNRHYLGRALKMGFREVSLYGPEAPAICHEGTLTFCR